MEFNQMSITKKSAEINVTFNGQIIAVKQYLPLMDKYYLAQGIINSCIEENGRVVNYVKKDLAYVYDIINAYTDIDLTSAETLEETANRYDAIVDSGLFNLILENIPENELNTVNTYIENGLMELQKYNTSPMMVLEDVIEIIHNSLDQLSTMSPDDVNRITEIGKNIIEENQKDKMENQINKSE